MWPLLHCSLRSWRLWGLPPLRKVDQLGWMSFVASLAQSAAWPAAVFVIVILIRKPLQEAVTHRLRRLKAGPIEAEFDAEAMEVRDEVRRIPEVAAAEPRQGAVSLVDELAQLVDVSPRGAVMEAFGRIEARLGDLLRAVGLSPPKRTAWQVADLAFDEHLISSETLDAVLGLQKLRNLAAHGAHDEIGRDRARDYLAMADAVLYAMRERPGPSPEGSTSRRPPPSVAASARNLRPDLDSNAGPTA
jgi:hypothetical protein